MDIECRSNTIDDGKDRVGSGATEKRIIMASIKGRDFLFSLGNSDVGGPQPR